MISYVFECGNCNYKSGFYYRNGPKRSMRCYSYGCKKCGKIVNYCNEAWLEAKKNPKCGKCGEELIDYPKKMKGFDFNTGTLECPKCGKNAGRITSKFV